MKRGIKLEKDDILRLKEMLDKYQDGDVLLMSQNSDLSDTIFAFVRQGAGVETLGPYDVVAIDGLDRYGIPMGEHTASCGCFFKGRSLLKPCEEHTWISGIPTSLTTLNLGEVITPTKASHIKESLQELIKMDNPYER